MSALAGAATWCAAGLLLVAGLAKVRSPLLAAATLKLLRLPSRRLAVFCLAAWELVLGVCVLVWARPLADGALAATFAAFAASIAWLLARGHRELSCGCLGSEPAPIGVGHVVANLVLAGAATVAAVGGSRSLVAVVGDGGEQILVLVAIPACVAALVALMAAMPNALQYYRGPFDLEDESGR